jgi:hypothetical protein
MVHKHGEIIDTLPANANKINCICTTRRGSTNEVDILLDSEYWLVIPDSPFEKGKVYKKTPNGKYRSLVMQTTRETFPHYFFKQKDSKRKLTLSVYHLDKLKYVDANPDVNTNSNVDEVTAQEL